MQAHTKAYLEHFGYGEEDFIPCEFCGKRAVDIMHIIPRSKFGKKRIDERDSILNLMAGCRTCHQKFDDGYRWTIEEAQKIHLFNLSRII